MRSWRENFGSFFTNSNGWDSQKVIEICRTDGLTGKDMVRQAIALAKLYGCRIVKPVEYVPEVVGGRILFTVECHTLTNRYFYDDGNTYRLNNSEVRDSDVERYFKEFGTRTCIDRHFKRKYWYRDNWHGDEHSFNTLKAAKEAASRETGNTVTIYRNHPYGRMNEIVCFAEASGFTPA